MYTCAGEDALSPVRAALEDRFRFVTQEAFSAACLSGEIIDRRFSKGSGVRCAAAALGFSLADTIGFGDSMNDYEMIETVGLGVCMENGCDALKRISDLVCPAVEDDGLARAFDQLGLG
jgi:hydroxymethylpyrimidine pyrophosphatase-like HAD family hydrolase